MLLYNVHVSSTAVDSVIECSKDAAKHSMLTNSTSDNLTPNCTVVTGFKIQGGNPVGLIYKPIYPSNDPTTLVGMVGLSVYFNKVLVNSIPHYYSGIVAVISTHRGTTHHTSVDYDTVTYDIMNGVPHLRGEGDLHDPKFDDFARSIVLNDVVTNANDQTMYTLTIYPSTFRQFRSNNPWIVVVGFICVIFASTIIFFLYDYLMRRQSSEQELILDLKRRFVRFISHEIRTPLSTVCMGLELLEDDIRSHTHRSTRDKAPDSQNDNGSLSGHTHTDVTSSDIETWYNITHDIQENASTAVMILNDLLNYDKIENGTLQLEVSDVEILSLVEKSVHKFQIQAANKEINLSFRVNACRCGTFQQYCSDTDTPLTQPPRDAIVIGDEMRLAQVVSNLISNSIKFTPSGGRVEVWMDHLSPPDCAPSRQSGEDISCGRVRRGSVVISVKDTGAGMTKEQLALIFAEGVQFDKNKLQAGGGSGLGLCISNGVVDRHDGYINADSDGPGKGSIFTIELPLYASSGNDRCQSEDGRSDTQSATASPDKDKVGSTSSTRSTIDDSFLYQTMVFAPELGESPTATTQKSSTDHDDKPQSRHILVVEDVASSQKMLVRLLERAGHTCETAWNGQDAIDKVKAAMNLTSTDESQHSDDAVEEGRAVTVKPFNTILMDFEMPVMNGPDATEEIRKLGFQKLIVGVTGNVLEEDVKYFISKGADTVLGKPVGIARLNEVWKDPHHRQSKILSRAMLVKIDSGNSSLQE
jgi:signal transduction histidine kinase/DNA-binding NarL/FixJ family response regulator